MHPTVRAVLQECIAASREEGLTFPQIVAKLIEVNVERYHLDLCRSEITYHLSDGESEILPTGKSPGSPAAVFSASGVASSVRAVQTSLIGYNAFCQQVLLAGCAGWHVSLLGKRVVYYGRTGETHVELFPVKK